MFAAFQHEYPLTAAAAFPNAAEPAESPFDIIDLETVAATIRCRIPKMPACEMLALAVPGRVPNMQAMMSMFGEFMRHMQPEIGNDGGQPRITYNSRRALPDFREYPSRSPSSRETTPGPSPATSPRNALPEEFRRRSSETEFMVTPPEAVIQYGRPDNLEAAQIAAIQQAAAIADQSMQQATLATQTSQQVIPATQIIQQATVQTPDIQQATVQTSVEEGASVIIAAMSKKKAINAALRKLEKAHKTEKAKETKPEET